MPLQCLKHVKALSAKKMSSRSHFFLLPQKTAKWMEKQSNELERLALIEKVKDRPDAANLLCKSLSPRAQERCFEQGHRPHLHTVTQANLSVKSMRMTLSENGPRAGIMPAPILAQIAAVKPTCNKPVKTCVAEIFADPVVDIDQLSAQCQRLPHGAL